jgi:hypothetical protein
MSTTKSITGSDLCDWLAGELSDPEKLAAIEADLLLREHSRTLSWLNQLERSASLLTKIGTPEGMRRWRERRREGRRAGTLAQDSDPETTFGLSESAEQGGSGPALIPSVFPAPPTPVLPPMSGMLGAQPAETGGLPSARRVRLELRAEECAWQAGDVTMAEGKPAVIELEWVTSEGANRLRVGVGIGGFLRLGPPHIMEVILRSPEGVELARGRSAHVFDPVELPFVDPQTLKSGDSLHIVHSRDPRDRPGWVVSFVLIL